MFRFCLSRLSKSRNKASARAYDVYVRHETFSRRLNELLVRELLQRLLAFNPPTGAVYFPVPNRTIAFGQHSVGGYFSPSLVCCCSIHLLADLYGFSVVLIVFHT